VLHSRATLVRPGAKTVARVREGGRSAITPGTELQKSRYPAHMARVHGHIVALQGRGVLTLPAELRRRHHLDEPGAQVSIVETEDGRIELIPLALVPASQAWFWTERWQKMEREVDDAVTAGEIEVFDDAESFLANLDALTADD
jgi:antitoxin MazE